MNTKIESIKVTFAAAASLLVLVIGESYKHIVVLLLLMAVDTFIGWIKGFKLGEWKSNKARWGAIGKIAELMIIACLYGLDWVFDMDWLKYIGIYYFGVCELASVLENFVQIGGNLPVGIIELIKELRYSFGTETVKKIKKIIEDLWEEDK